MTDWGTMIKMIKLWHFFRLILKHKSFIVIFSEMFLSFIQDSLLQKLDLKWDKMKTF